MKLLSYFFTILLSVLPMLWIENYTFRSPIWWTVMTTWILGRLFGWIENEVR